MMDFESWFIYVLKENHDDLLRHKSLYDLLEMAFDAGAKYQMEYSTEDDLFANFDSTKFLEENPELLNQKSYMTEEKYKLFLVAKKEKEVEKSLSK